MRRMPLEAHFSRGWNLVSRAGRTAGVSFSFTPEQFRSFVRQLHHLRGSEDACGVRRVVLSDGKQASPSPLASNQESFQIDPITDYVRP
jgi:hypothetical protein